MSFELIEAEEAHYRKALMCRALGLSRSGHHAYSTRGPSRRALEKQQLDVLVAAVFAELGGRYGAPRIEQELRRRGHRTSTGHFYFAGDRPSLLCFDNRDRADNAPSVHSPHLTTPPSQGRNTPCVGAKHAVSS
jgi:hypothetical protein